MRNIRSITLPRVLTFLAGLLILKVTVAVVLKYRDYFPPNFASDFLRGREAYFWGSYSWAFYIHIAFGPIALVLGLILVSERFRLSFPKWHRMLGKIQAMAVLFLVAPSGLWMAFRAEAGSLAGAGFASLAVLTATCVVMGWRLAVKRRFAEHRVWMWRCFLLLCSAVVIRVIGGLAAVTGAYATWINPLAAWGSWLVPLAVYEIKRATNIRSRGSLVPTVREDNARDTPGIRVDAKEQVATGSLEVAVAR